VPSRNGFHAFVQVSRNSHPFLGRYLAHIFLDILYNPKISSSISYIDAFIESKSSLWSYKKVINVFNSSAER